MNVSHYRFTPIWSSLYAAEFSSRVREYAKFANLERSEALDQKGKQLARQCFEFADEATRALISYDDERIEDETESTK